MRPQARVGFHPAQIFPESVKATVATQEMWRLPAKIEEEAAIQNALEKRKMEYRAGRHCAASVLSQLGIDGYPLINDSRRAPQWPDNVVGSITHCDNYCCAVATNDPTIMSIGIDAETLEALPEESTPLICSKDELAYLIENNLTEDYWPKVIFSAKEAFYKAYYPLCHQYLDFLNARVKIDIPSKQDDKETIYGIFSIHILTQANPALYNRQSFTGKLLIDSAHILCGVTIKKP